MSWSVATTGWHDPIASAATAAKARRARTSYTRSARARVGPRGVHRYLLLLAAAVAADVPRQVPVVPPRPRRGLGLRQLRHWPDRHVPGDGRQLVKVEEARRRPAASDGESAVPVDKPALPNARLQPSSVLGPPPPTHPKVDLFHGKLLFYFTPHLIMSRCLTLAAEASDPGPRSPPTHPPQSRSFSRKTIFLLYSPPNYVSLPNSGCGGVGPRSSAPPHPHTPK